jgi:CubicO group peptidase (beta-lactamase class C family)
MARRVRFLATVFVAANLGFSPLAHAKPHAAAGGLPAAVTPEAVGFDSTRLKLLDAAMDKVVADRRIPGMTTLLVRHGKVVEFATYGTKSWATGQPMTPDTLFRIYSMSKPLTGVAMMILFEEGKWRLDDPVTRFLPELKDLKVWKGVDDKGQPILEPVIRPPTMRELMSHTAGFGYGLSDKHPVDRMFRDQKVLASQGLKEMTAKVAGIPLLFQPGTDWSYSVAVDLQGAIVERITGETFSQFLQERVFGPLKMKDTAFMVPADKVSRLASVYGIDPKTGKLVEAVAGSGGGGVQDFTRPPAMESGGGGLISTTADYGRFAQMILNKGELDGARILSPASVELMDTNVVPRSVLVKSNGTSRSFFSEAVGFGLDFMVEMQPREAGSLEGRNTMSWGGAAGTWFWIDPTNDLYFVGMIQRYGGSGGDDLGMASRTLTYQALIHPEK